MCNMEITRQYWRHNSKYRNRRWMKKKYWKKCFPNNYRHVETKLIILKAYHDDVNCMKYLGLSSWITSVSVSSTEHSTSVSTCVSCDCINILIIIIQAQCIQTKLTSTIITGSDISDIWLTIKNIQPSISSSLVI